MHIHTVSLQDLERAFYTENGELFWKLPRRGKHKQVGDKAGSPHKTRRYWKVVLDGIPYKVHRIIYQMHHKIDKLDSNLVIDHIDRNPENNRIENLRLVSQTENIHNSFKQKNNTSGQRGVSYYSRQKKWGARISILDHRYFLGLYDSFDDACVAYQFAAKLLRGEYGAIDIDVTGSSALRYRHALSECGVLPLQPERIQRSLV